MTIKKLKDRYTRILEKLYNDRELAQKKYDESKHNGDKEYIVLLNYSDVRYYDGRISEVKYLLECINDDF